MKLRAFDVAFRAVQRGYTLDEIRPCLLHHFGDGIYEVDVEHAAYPRTPKEGYSPPESLRSAAMALAGALGAVEIHSTPPGGPGTELKALLAKIGIKSSPTCSCNKRAKAMDENGIEWCEQNVETICDWLAEESAKRKLPFVRLAGKAIIHMAIRRAKKGNKK
jgi:hypothetical protein